MTSTLLPKRLTAVQYLVGLLAVYQTATFAAMAANQFRFPPALPMLCDGCRLAGRFWALHPLVWPIVLLIGAAGSVALVYAITVRETRSKWLGVIATGLFSAFCKLGHPDPWPIVLVLAGCYLIGYGESRRREAFGMLFFVAAFWVAPLTAIFALGGLGYLSWRDLRTGASSYRSWPAALLAVLLGPALYVIVGGSVAGITLDLRREEFIIFAEFLARYLAIPAVLAGAGLQMSLERSRPLSIWTFFLPIAFLGGMLAMFAAGSQGFMPFGVWLILLAVLAAPRLTRAVAVFEELQFSAIALGISLLILSFPAVLPKATEGRADAAEVRSGAGTAKGAETFAASRVQLLSARARH